MVAWWKKTTLAGDGGCHGEGLGAYSPQSGRIPCRAGKNHLCNPGILRTEGKEHLWLIQAHTGKITQYFQGNSVFLSLHSARWSGRVLWFTRVTSPTLTQLFTWASNFPTNAAFSYLSSWGARGAGWWLLTPWSPGSLHWYTILWNTGRQTTETSVILNAHKGQYINEAVDLISLLVCLSSHLYSTLTELN